MKDFENRCEASGDCGVLGDDFLSTFYGRELFHHVRLQEALLFEVAAAKVEAHDGIANRPVPLVVDMKPFEQRLIALEQFLQRVQKQAFAKATRTR